MGLFRAIISTFILAGMLIALSPTPAHALRDCRIRKYKTAAEITARSDSDCLISYALDTDVYYVRAAGSWVIIAGSGGMAGTNGGTFGNETNNAWQFGENSEDWVLTFGTNTVTYSSSTGATMVVTPAVAITGDLTLDGAAGALTMTTASSSVVVTDASATGLVMGSTGRLDLLRLDTQDSLEAVEITGTTTAKAFHVDAGTALFDEGVDIAVPALALGVIRFCGTMGATATTSHFFGPVLLDDTEADLAFGGAGCDGLDNSTETTADAPWHASFAFTPVAMACTTNGGVDDVLTFQLRDDAADVTGMTCNVTLTGSAITCAVRDPTPVAVAANSALCIDAVADTDDNLSAVDAECLVYITF